MKEVRKLKERGKGKKAAGTNSRKKPVATGKLAKEAGVPVEVLPPEDRPRTKQDLIPRDEFGRFKKGYNPTALGFRPKDTRPNQGRRRVLEIFDRVVGEDGHCEMLEVEMRRYIEDHGMIAFYKEFIFPLIPKEMILKNLSGMKDMPTSVSFNFGPRTTATNLSSQDSEDLYNE